MINHTTIQTCNSKHDTAIAYAALSGCGNSDTAGALACQQQDHQELCGGHEALCSSQYQQLSLYRSVLQQLDALSWSRVASVSEDLSSITLQLVDTCQRLHMAVVSIPKEFPDVAPSVDISLPKPLKLKWAPGHTLLQLVRQVEQVSLPGQNATCKQVQALLTLISKHQAAMLVYTLQALEAYQILWEQLEDLDQHTQLLDPAEALGKPYSNCTRCIALGNGASCQVRLSAVAPRSLPSVTFHGPSSVTAGLQSLWYSCAHSTWDEACSVRRNLEATLQASASDSLALQCVEIPLF